MAELAAKIKEADAAGARFKLIATDGVFSMDGIVADLKSICDLADRYGPMPDSVLNLADYGRIRVMADRLGIEGTIVRPTGIFGAAGAGARS